jgi:FkbM family methyltransferase
MAKVVHLGTEYGGHHIFPDLIPQGSTCICAGVGNDLSFGHALMQEFGAFIVWVDPTALAVETVQAATHPSDRYTHIVAALCEHGGEVEFSAARSNGAGIDTPGRKLLVSAVTLGEVFRHYPEAVYVKLDIEGAEWSVLRGLAENVRPALLSVDYHPRAGEDIDAAMSVMRKHGYDAHDKGWVDLEQSEREVLYTCRRS